MKTECNSRGFVVAEFEDANGEKCSIQESSALREEGLLWLGIDRVQPKCRRTDGPWQDVPMPEESDTFWVLSSGRMHLTQSQVRELLPLLQRFAETGCLEERE